MNRLSSKLLCCIFALVLVFAFSTSLLAANTDSFYTEEEAGVDTEFFTVIPLTDGFSPSAQNGNLVIVLDPGHGPADSGAVSVADTYERDLNLAVAKYCKAYLERYSNVSVYLTHDSNSGSKKLELSERAAIAAGHGADLLISIHFNSAVSNTMRGAEAYVSLLEEYEVTALAASIVDHLGNLGLKEIGVKTRKSESGDMWTDEIRIADYYGLIRGGCKQEIPSMIVEHCFINNNDDYYTFADTDAKLKALGEADAKAIVSYFGLDQSIADTTLENVRYTALQKLDEQYNAMDQKRYNGYYQAKIEQIYADAKNRITIANNVGKIDLTVNRAVKTLKNYPQLAAGETQFSDVKTTDWFWPAVDYCVENKLFYGVNETTFAPNDPITRGQFIAVLGRNAGVAETTPTQTKFSDVDPNQYYAPHIAWATEKGIVAGFSDSIYGPDQQIRREDLLKMLHNYCIANNIELPTVSTKTAADFKDGNLVDHWATNDVAWALEKGIITGYEDNTIRPTNSTTRAEVAQIMMSFQKTLAELDAE